MNSDIYTIEYIMGRNDYLHVKHIPNTIPNEVPLPDEDIMQGCEQHT